MQHTNTSIAIRCKAKRQCQVSSQNGINKNGIDSKDNDNNNSKNSKNKSNTNNYTSINDNDSNESNKNNNKKRKKRIRKPRRLLDHSPLDTDSDNYESKTENEMDSDSDNCKDNNETNDSNIDNNNNDSNNNNGSNNNDENEIARVHDMEVTFGENADDLDIAEFDMLMQFKKDLDFTEDGLFIRLFKKCCVCYNSGRIISSFSGKNAVCCGGHVFGGVPSQYCTLSFTFVLILAPLVGWYWIQYEYFYVTRHLLFNLCLVLLVSVPMTVASLYFLLRTNLTDPGVVPRCSKDAPMHNMISSIVYDLK